jgi:hypothetical protein
MANEKPNLGAGTELQPKPTFVKIPIPTKIPGAKK